jgi:hypothetical protein
VPKDETLSFSRLTSISVIAASLLMSISLGACSSAGSETAALTTAADSADPTPAKIDPVDALEQMKSAVANAKGTEDVLFRSVDPAKLAPPLDTRFFKAKSSLEQFAFAHGDQGDIASSVSFILSGAGASTFIGYVVMASGGDDSDNWSARATGYYTTDGKLLDLESFSMGLSDSEDSGDWSHVDQATVDAEQRVLETAFSFDADHPSVKLADGKSQPAKADGLPFAKLVQKIQAELERSTQAHSDNGDDATRFVSVADDAGNIAGYILTTDGSDDSDSWFAASYALFSAQGQMLDRKIATSGFADTMDDDAVLLPKP